MRFVCTACGKEYPPDTRLWRCECGGYFVLKDAPAFREGMAPRREPSLWRYREALPPVEQPITLGEGLTPLVDARWRGRDVLFKLEYLAPTGSFKDRGTTVLVSFLAGLGVDEVVEDSSGNAGASLAAYAARAGIKARIFVPAYASPAKKAQIAVYGAELVEVEGPRENAARAVQKAAAKGAYYASHYHNPLIIEGMKTMAYEIWEQLEGRVPDNVVAPVGHGTLLLGLYRGFGELVEAGLARKIPRLFGVQSQNCAPLAAAFESGAQEVRELPARRTVAEGISIVKPLRGSEILRAVRGTGGRIVAVPEEGILPAREELARLGFYVEPTSAVPLAGLELLGLGPGEVTVGPLTGSGLKG